MMKPRNTILWRVQSPNIERCVQNISVDVVVIGGGMAGLSAAHGFALRGKKVAVLEKGLCGSGATGKSAGFITPNAELSFTQFHNRYGNQAATDIWSLINQGGRTIQNNIKTHNFDCNYLEQDGMMAATKKRSMDEIVTEYQHVVKAGYPVHLYDQKSIQSVLHSTKYFGGVSYPDSFGINGDQYCHEMKRLLQSMGVHVFEESPAVGIDGHAVSTPYATVTAETIVVCVDRFLEDLSSIGSQVHHVQSFIVASKPLTDAQHATIFTGRNVMVSDTDLIYNYFRMTADRRLILGGSDFYSLFEAQRYGYSRITKKLSCYFQTMFPLSNLEFEYQWSGLIGLSKDTAPILGAHKKYPHVYVVSAVAGLPVAAALGSYAVQHYLDGRRDMDQLFAYDRPFLIDGMLQKLMGKKLSFAINNAWMSSGF